VSLIFKEIKDIVFPLVADLRCYPGNLVISRSFFGMNGENPLKQKRTPDHCTGKATVQQETPDANTRSAVCRISFLYYLEWS